MNPNISSETAKHAALSCPPNDTFLFTMLHYISNFNSYDKPAWFRHAACSNTYINKLFIDERSETIDAHNWTHVADHLKVNGPLWTQ